MAKYSYSEQKRSEIIEKMKNDWEIDTQHLEIKLKEKPWYKRIWKWLILTRYTMRELYIYVYNHFHDPSRIRSLMPIAFPFDHDNFKKPKSIPSTFVLRSGWIIPEEYLSKLIKGPLISEDGTRVLVATHSRLKIILDFSKLITILRTNILEN